MAGTAQQPFELFDVHLQKQPDRISSLQTRYMPVELLGANNMKLTETGFLRSIVYKVRPRESTVGYTGKTRLIMKMQPAGTAERFDLARSEVAIHWLITQLAVIGLRRRDGATSIERHEEMLRSVVDLKCANVVRLYDWAAEFYQQHVFLDPKTATSDEQANEVKAVKRTITTWEKTHGITVINAFRLLRTPSGKYDKPPLVMATIMEDGGVQLTSQLEDPYNLTDDYILPMMAQALQFINALTTMHASHMDYHTDNMYVSESIELAPAGMFYYYLDKNSVLRIPPTKNTNNVEKLLLLKLADFGFSVMRTRDTANRFWKVEPAHDRFLPYKKGLASTAVEPRAGLVMSPAYDYLRLATAVASKIILKVNPDRGKYIKQCRRTLKLLADMIRHSQPLSSKNLSYEQLVGAIETIANADDIQMEAIGIFGNYYTANQWLFGGVTTLEQTLSTLKWPVDLLREHFHDYIVTPEVIDEQMAVHPENVRLCADMTLRHSVGAKNRFLPESQSPADAPKAGYNHAARALGLAELK